MITILCQLVAQECDFGGYITYVFETLEYNPPFGHKYIMVTRFPNWQARDLDIGEVGYLTYNEVIAGKDTWYDSVSQKFIPYNYSNLIFIKFVKQQDNEQKDILL